jgi:uncharacterized protein YndB with AHSA1/START domain
MTPAKDESVFSVTPLSDKEIVIRRVFNAPKQLVFDALTKPEMMKNWFWGPDGWTLAMCDIDLRVGGEARYVWRKGDIEMGMSSVFIELDPPNRLVSKERFDDPWYEGEAIGTVELTENEGKTTLTTTMKYTTEAARDSALKSPMDEGMAVGYTRLENYLETLK